MPRNSTGIWVARALLVASVLLVLLIPTLVGFSAVEGGLLLFLGIVAAVVALYLLLRTEGTCQACRVEGETHNKGER